MTHVKKVDKDHAKGVLVTADEQTTVKTSMNTLLTIAKQGLELKHLIHARTYGFCVQTLLPNAPCVTVSIVVADVRHRRHNAEFRVTNAFPHYYF